MLPGRLAWLPTFRFAIQKISSRWFAVSRDTGLSGGVPSWYPIRDKAVTTVFKLYITARRANIFGTTSLHITHV